jgi:hypothetical protein
MPEKSGMPWLRSCVNPDQERAAAAAVAMMTVRTMDFSL